MAKTAEEALVTVLREHFPTPEVLYRGKQRIYGRICQFDGCFFAHARGPVSNLSVNPYRWFIISEAHYKELKSFGYPVVHFINPNQEI